VDSSGLLWYAHGDTLTSFDGSVSKDYYSYGMGISSDRIAVANDGSFWMVLGSVGVNNWTNAPTWKLARFKPGTLAPWTLYAPPSNWSYYRTFGEYAPHIAIDQSGTIWIGTDGAGLFSFDGTAWNNYNPYNSDIGCPFIEDIVVDTNNNKWMTSWNFENTVMEFNENGIDHLLPTLIYASLQKLVSKVEYGSVGKVDTSLVVTNLYGRPGKWTLSFTPQPWLTASIDSLPTDSAKITLNFTVDAKQLRSYYDTLWVSFPNASNSPFPIPIECDVVSENPYIFLPTTSINFTMDSWDAATSQSFVAVVNDGNLPLNWTVYTKSKWLEVTKASNSLVQVQLQPANLATGAYQDTIWISCR